MCEEFSRGCRCWRGAVWRAHWAPKYYRRLPHTRRSGSVTRPILRCSTSPALPSTTVKGSPPPRLPSPLLNSMPAIPAIATGNRTGARRRKIRTAAAWSTANPRTCHPLRACSEKKRSNSGSSSTQGGHQVAQKFSNSGLPEKSCILKLESVGVSKLSCHSAGRPASCSAFCRRCQAARPTPKSVAPPATAPTNQRLRFTGTAPSPGKVD